MSTSIGNICQSCGVPIKRITDFGTYADGSVNTDYCRFCYKEGDFLDAGISLEEKIKKDIARAVVSGIPPDMARRNALSIIPRLRRWRKNKAAEPA